MTALLDAGFEWRGRSDDPNDEQFGDVVEATTLDDAGEYDAVLVGEPYDGAVIGRRGAREGPAAVREALAGLKTHHFDAGPAGPVGDLGTVDIPDGDVASVQRAVRDAAAAVHGADAFPVFLGGDNSLTYANAGPLLGGGSVGVVNVDAHLDVREPLEGPSSGTPYRQLLDDGLDGYACVGARHFETSTAYHDHVRERGGAVVTAEEVGEDPVTAADRALDALGDVDRVYLSLDCDVLDAAAAPGVSAPTPGGISTRECFRLLRLLAADERVAGYEVVECAPPLDRDGLTVAAAARAVAHVLAARGAGVGA
ncbi:formimidoylglutamase [Halobaculum roseum]|uniref:Formimidoylglutamase n=1 Tax=Halobaculum roseum TaxID=2175149 RepID=A0ABD5MPP1_9EURY|nr:formimidoylglutamase [Halobaculum roseum]QZY01663.1 formimidoylglutamase [Halobaculum roseum]